jgi:hypothetical protein
VRLDSGFSITFPQKNIFLFAANSTKAAGFVVYSTSRIHLSVAISTLCRYYHIAATFVKHESNL